MRSVAIACATIRTGREIPCLFANSCEQRIAARNQIVQVTRRHFSECTEPLRTVRSHPNAVAGCHRIPGVFQSINTPALQHQQAMLHDVGFYKGEASARFVVENIRRKIKGRIIR